MTGPTVETIGWALVMGLCREDDVCAALCTQLVRLLLEGQPVSSDRLAAALGTSRGALVGTLRCWRWLFWLLLIAFGISAIRVPLLPLQLAGLIPGAGPPWYDVLQAGVGAVQGAMAAWMLQLYRRDGVWASRPRDPQAPTRQPDGTAHAG